MSDYDDEISGEMEENLSNLGKHSVTIGFYTNNIKLLHQSFNLLKDYILEENDTQNILMGISQLSPLFKSLLQHPDTSLDFMDSEDFNKLNLKIKLLSSYKESQDFLNLSSSNEKSFPLLKKELKSYFFQKNETKKLFLADAYIDFHDTLKSALENKDYNKIKLSWNKNFSFFDSDKITHQLFSEKFDNDKLSKDIYSDYFKIVKLSQEKIVGLLCNHFLKNPEEIQPLSKYVPEFFLFMDWHQRSEQTTQDFAVLLEQKHWDNLMYASETKGFTDFLDKVLFLTPKESDNDDEFNPLDDDATTTYNHINLNIIKNFNSKNITIDSLFTNNHLNIAPHLRDYLYYHIELLEKQDKRHSTSEFHELDKLLTIYEKQKLESIFISNPNKNKVKTNKI